MSNEWTADTSTRVFEAEFVRVFGSAHYSGVDCYHASGWSHCILIDPTAHAKTLARFAGGYGCASEAGENEVLSALYADGALALAFPTAGMLR